MANSRLVEPCGAWNAATKRGNLGLGRRWQWEMADAGRIQWSKPAATRHLAVYHPLEDQAEAPGTLSTDHRA